MPPCPPKLVEEVFSRFGEVLELTIAGEILTSTTEHPFYVKDRGWLAAEDLMPGDLLAIMPHVGFHRSHQQTRPIENFSTDPLSDSRESDYASSRDRSALALSNPVVERELECDNLPNRRSRRSPPAVAERELERDNLPDEVLWQPLEAIRKTGEAIRVYNFRVAQWHTYFVGHHNWDFSVWVHNSHDTIDVPREALEQSAKALKEAAPNSVLTRSQIITQAQEALGPLAKQFPDAKVGIRGSLARGTKGVHKGGGPFDPTNYDVDAFIVSDELAAAVPKNAEGFRNLGRLSEHQSLIKTIGDRLRAIAGHRQDTVKIRVFSEAEFRALSPDEVSLLP